MKRVLIITTIVFMILAKILKPESENYPETGKVVSISGDAVTVERQREIFSSFTARKIGLLATA